MKFSFITNKDLGILIYWVDNKGLIGKRDLNKYIKDNRWTVNAAMDEQSANDLLQLLTN